MGQGMAMGCARGGMSAHVASSEGLSVFSLSARSVCAHVVGCCDLPVYLDFAVRVCACLCLKEVCARVLPVWRVCASTGSVLVAWELCLCSHAIGCVLWSVRACGVLHSTLPLFDWCLRESTCVGVCVCVCVCVWSTWGRFEVFPFGFCVAPEGYPVADTPTARPPLCASLPLLKRFCRR